MNHRKYYFNAMSLSVSGLLLVLRLRNLDETKAGHFHVRVSFSRRPRSQVVCGTSLHISRRVQLYSPTPVMSLHLNGWSYFRLSLPNSRFAWRHTNGPTTSLVLSSPGCLCCCVKYSRYGSDGQLAVRVLLKPALGISASFFPSGFFITSR